jgi:hypothetical protein
VADITPYAGSHDTRLGRESSWPQISSETIFFRPLMVKGLFCALTGRAAFLFRGNVKYDTYVPYFAVSAGLHDWRIPVFLPHELSRFLSKIVQINNFS